ncbi:hypothetical protein F5880DRAFT_1615532 [Lentinula raphanica]|nr:hypothetical protein F5880DRAFT_1615532 [Lentinula raphanica]
MGHLFNNFAHTYVGRGTESEGWVGSTNPTRPREYSNRGIFSIPTRALVSLANGSTTSSQPSVTALTYGPPLSKNSSSSLSPFSSPTSNSKSPTSSSPSSSSNTANPLYAPPRTTSTHPQPSPLPLSPPPSSQSPLLRNVPETR